MQEVDVKTGTNEKVLSIKGYNLYLETNDTKSRCGIYIRATTKHYRRVELEETNNWLLILDVDLKKNTE